jgi:uncharacterized membrane protein
LGAVALMNPEFELLLAFGIGVVAGLRSMTSPAVIAWGAYLGWLDLTGSPLAFMGSLWAVVVFTLAALGEYVGDLLPSTPARTSPVGLSVRILTGLFTGACIGIARGALPWLAAVLGGIGAVAGAFGGYQARTRLVRALHAPDFAIAAPEDLVAIGLGLLLVSRF